MSAKSEDKSIVDLLFALAVAACVHTVVNSPANNSVGSAAATEKENVALSEGEIIYGYRNVRCGFKPRKPAKSHKAKSPPTTTNYRQFNRQFR